MINIEEILKWEHKLKNLENFVALQIIKNIYSNSNIENSLRKQLLMLMKVYSVRTVFEACFVINSASFNLKQIENKCDNIIQKNKKMIK